MSNNLEKLAKLIRYYILTSTTQAGSGHPTTCLSAVELMTTLMFGLPRGKAGGSASASRERDGFYRFDLSQPDYLNNDRLIFSKGHAAPLLYALYAVATSSHHPHLTSPLKGEERKDEDHQIAVSSSRGGGLGRGEASTAITPEELLTLRKFNSRLEGHPTMEFPYTEVPTGSLGQGLSAGVGMALNAKLSAKGGSASGGDKTLSYRTFVLLGDSEMAEGSNWEAIQIAAHYKLNNLIAILDVNRLGQSRETMYGHNLESYQKKLEAFGWKTFVIDGHDLNEIQAAFTKAVKDGEEFPKIIIAKTFKGKGVSFLEDKEGWHGKPLSADELKKALEELGEVDKSRVGVIAPPERVTSLASGTLSDIGRGERGEVKVTEYKKGDKIATRRAYGNALVNIYPAFPNMVVMDGETSNSTFSEIFRKAHPDRYLEMFIAEQNMVGVAMGLSRRGKIPFISTFAAFLTRAFDQIRMSQYSKSNIKFCGSHGGVSIGEDGPSQMGLEDIAMFRTLLDSVVLYPCDAVSCEKLVAAAAAHKGNVYIRTTRKDTSILYDQDEEFKIGGSKTLRSSDSDQITVIGAGITLHEALAAYEELKKENINIRIVDLYSIKPIDITTLQKAAQETKAIITVEDHFAAGGIAEAVAGALCGYSVHHILESLAVKKMPKSGKPEELLDYEEISKNAIINKVREVVSSKL